MKITCYIGDGTASDIIKNYIQNQGNQEEKQVYKQMKIVDLSKNSISGALARTYHLLAVGAPAQF
jgi:hypothetical protein